MSELYEELEIIDAVQDETEKFSTIVIDPPWLERGGGKITSGADKH